MRHEIRIIYKDGAAFSHNNSSDPMPQFTSRLHLAMQDESILRVELIQYKDDTKTLIAVWDREGIFENGEIQSGNRKRKFHNTHMS